MKDRDDIDDSGWERRDAWIGLAFMTAGALICFLFYQIISGDMWVVVFFAGAGWLAGPILLLAGGAAFYWGITAPSANRIPSHPDESPPSSLTGDEANGSSSPQAEPLVRRLTISETTTVSARLLSRRGEQLGVEIAGKHQEIPISLLSADDQRFIESQMPSESS